MLGQHTKIGRELLITSTSRSNLRTSSVRGCHCISGTCILRNNSRVVMINVDCDDSAALHFGNMLNSLLLHLILTTLYEKRKKKHPKMKKWTGSWLVQAPAEPQQRSPGHAEEDTQTHTFTRETNLRPMLPRQGVD